MGWSVVVCWQTYWLISLALCTAYIPGVWAQIENCDKDFVNITSGLVTSPFYNYGYSSLRPHDCYWRVTVKPGHRIRVVFHAPFEINYLGYDYLNIYDSSTSDVSKRLYRLNRKVAPPPFTTTGNSLFVQLQLDNTRYIIGGKGFSFTFTEYGPQSEVLAEAFEGQILSRDYPMTYLPNENYDWLITVPYPLHIQLIFEDWGLDGGVLEIFSGDSANSSRLLWSLTSNYVNPRYSPPPESTMPNIFIPNNQAFLTLETRGLGRLAINYRGVDLSVCPSVAPPNNGAVLSPDGLTLGSTISFTCNQGYTLIGPASLTCVADTETSPYWKGETPVCRVSNDCIRRLEIESGFGQITSPGYPNSYTADRTCSWYISTNPGYQIELTFSPPFSLTDGQSNLDIYDGGSKLALRLARLTGDLMPFPIWSSHNHLTLEFTANGSSSGQGFSLNYNVSAHANAQCGHQFSGENGVIYSPNYPDVFKRELHCSWTLFAPEGFVIQMIPEGLLREDYYIQYLTFALPSGQFPRRLAKAQKSIMSRGSSVYVQLDGSKISKDIPGFRIVYKALPLEVSLPGATEGVIQSPNYPYDTSSYSTFWWNLTAPQDHRFTFHIFGGYTINNSELSFFEYIHGNWTKSTSITDYFHSRRVHNFESVTGTVHIKLTTIYSTYFQMKYKAFPVDECPPLLMGNLSSTYSGHQPGESINVSCVQGHILNGPSNLSCQPTEAGQMGASWKSRDISCIANLCAGMLQAVNDTYGHVTSLGFPGLTNPGLECRIDITVPANHRVVVRFTACSLGYDFKLKLYKNKYQKYMIPERTWPAIYTFDNFLQIYSKNPGNNARGFRLLYQVIPIDSSDSFLLNESLCLHPGGTKDATWDRTDYSFQFGETINYTCRSETLAIGSDTLVCTNGTNGVAMWDSPPPFCSEVAFNRCNRTVQSGTGVISPLMMKEYEPCSPYPGTWACDGSSNSNQIYVNGQDCRLYFDVPDGYIVQIEGVKASYLIDLVRDDYIFIYDGLSTQDPLLYNLSYTSIRALPETSFPHSNLNTRHQKLMFRFLSNEDSGARGFSLRYSVIKTDGCSDPWSFDPRGWTQATRASGSFENGDQIKYGCIQTYNRTGELRVCNGTNHTWSGSPSQCLGAPYFNIDVEWLSHLYTPDYPEKTAKRGNWNISTPRDKGIEVRYQSCRLGAWRTGLSIYESGYLVVKKYYEKSWYERVRLNVDPPFIFRLPVNQFQVTLFTDNTGICDIQMKLYDLPNDCGSPVPGKHQRLVSTSHRLGQSALVICHDGFYLPDGKSSTVLICADDRKWTPRVPNCEAPCGGTIQLSEGVIYSQNFPDAYPVNRICVWKIEGALGTIVSLNFTILDIRTSDSIGYRDTVSVLDGKGSSARYIVSNYSGSYVGFTRLSQTNAVSIIMDISNNYYQSKAGLKVFFKVYHPYICSPLSLVDFLERAEIEKQPENNTATVEYTCQYPYSVIGEPLITCKPDGQWDYPQPTCAGSCGGTSNRLSGSIISQGYPKPVTGSTACQWYLNTGAVKGKGFRLMLDDVSMVDGDILEVYDGQIDREMTTQYTWRSLPERFCGTSFGLTIRLVPGGENSGHANTSLLSTCTTSSNCQCRFSEHGCKLCEMDTDISVIRRCLEKHGGVDTGADSALETALNCTILGIAQTLGHLFGGNITGIDTSLNCSQDAMNVTNLPPSIFQCLGNISATPCNPCRTVPHSNITKFNVSFAAVVPLENCEKADLVFPRMTYSSVQNGDSAEVGETAFVSCENGYFVEGADGRRVMCAHSNTWDIRGVGCTCNYHSRYSYGVMSTFGWPNRYHNNLHCITRVSANPGFIIKIMFTTIRLMENDWVKFFDGNSTDGNMLASFENTLSVPGVPIYTTQPELTMEFFTDNDAVEEGVDFEYFTIPPACQDGQHQLLLLNSTASLANFSQTYLPYKTAKECTWLIMTPEHLIVQTSIKISNYNGVPVELSTYEGDRMNGDTQTSLKNSTVSSKDDYTSQTNRFWLRLRLFQYTELYLAVNFTARAPCPRLAPPTNGCIVSRRPVFSVGDVLPVRCDRGYYTNQSNPTCIDQQGVLMWDNSLPDCIPVGDQVNEEIRSCQDVTTTTTTTTRISILTTKSTSQTSQATGSTSTLTSVKTQTDSKDDSHVSKSTTSSTNKPTTERSITDEPISPIKTTNRDDSPSDFSSLVMLPVTQANEGVVGDGNGATDVRPIRCLVLILCALLSCHTLF